MRTVPERDWKKLRSMKDDKLNTACERILIKLMSLIEKRGPENHKTYLKLWKLLKNEDNEISVMFDDLKRSNAINKLAAWKRNELLDEGELEQFTEETQERISLLSDMHRS